MISLDQKWLKKYSIDSNRINRLITLKITTFINNTPRNENGMEITQPLIDHYALMYFSCGVIPPIILIKGRLGKLVFGMFAENTYLKRILKFNAHEKNELIKLEGYGQEIIYPRLTLLKKK